eukprot:tig00000157_g9705.t1
MGRYQAGNFAKKQVFQMRDGAMLNPGDSLAKRAAAAAKQAQSMEPYLEQPAFNSGAHDARPDYRHPSQPRIVPEQAPAAGHKTWYYQNPQPAGPRVGHSTAVDPLGVPAEFKNKILRFEAFFWENVTDTAFEPVRIRKCLMYYFLEDDTMQIIEPRQDNSGIPQGVFLKRHRVMSDTRQFVTWADINLRSDLVLYGRRFRVVNCDDFTRHFYKCMNRTLEPPEPYPEDPHEKHQREERERRLRPPGKPSPAVDPVKRYMEAQLGKPTHLLQKSSNPQQWLANDRKVLRFYCQWDDRERMYGDRHQFVRGARLPSPALPHLPDPRGWARPSGMLARLSSPSLPRSPRRLAWPSLRPRPPASPPPPSPARPVLEEQPRTSLGFVHYTPVLRRQRLPKDYRNGVAAFGAAAFYQPQDLRVGDAVNVFGRSVLLYDCDDFTRQYYADAYGIVQGAMPTPRTEKREAPPMRVPAHEGFMIGAEEDTLQNTRALQPKPLQRLDYWKFMHYDQTVLQFNARLDTQRPEDIDRDFVVKFHLADDTMAITESAPPFLDWEAGPGPGADRAARGPRRNSGLLGGKFLQRAKVKDPRTGEYYSERDLFVGASLEVHRRVFFLTEADEFTLRFMESNSEYFMVAHVPAIHDKLQRVCRAREGLYEELRGQLRAADRSGRGLLDMLDFQVVLGQLELGLVDHEVITLMRHYDPSRVGLVAYEDFCAAIAGPSDYVPPEERRAARDAALAAAQQGLALATLGPAAQPRPAPAAAWGDQPAPAPRGPEPARRPPAAAGPRGPRTPAPAGRPSPRGARTPPSPTTPRSPPPARPRPAPAPVPPYAYGPPPAAQPAAPAASVHYPYATQTAAQQQQQQQQQQRQAPGVRPPSPGRFGPEPVLRSPTKAAGPTPRYVSPRNSYDGRPPSPGPAVAAAVARPPSPARGPGAQAYPQQPQAYAQPAGAQAYTQQQPVAQDYAYPPAGGQWQEVPAPQPSETPRVPPPVGATPHPAVAAAQKADPNRSIYTNLINPHPQVPEVPVGSVPAPQPRNNNPLYMTTSQKAFGRMSAEDVAAANAAPRGAAPYVAQTAQARLSQTKDAANAAALKQLSGPVLARKEVLAAMQANRFGRR